MAERGGRAFNVAAAEEGDHLDRVVARHAGLSRRQARLLIARGLVCVNRQTWRILTRPVRAGMRIEIILPSPPLGAPELASAAAEVAADAGASDGRGVGAVQVLHIDRSIVVVNKPAGLLSETDRIGSPSLETVVPQLLAQRGEKNRAIWLVHRLDSGTSGVVVLARKASAVRYLNELFRQAKVRKCYWALCGGVLPGEQVVEAPLQRLQGVRQGVHAGGKAAITLLRPLLVGLDATLVEALPRTGRTHQIRVHLAHVGYPILGDRLYGGRGYTAGAAPQVIPRPMLHALQLVINHPESGESRCFEAPVPPDFVAVAAAVGIDIATRPTAGSGGLTQQPKGGHAQEKRAASRHRGIKRQNSGQT